MPRPTKGKEIDLLKQTGLGWINLDSIDELKQALFLGFDVLIFDFTEMN